MKQEERVPSSHSNHSNETVTISYPCVTCTGAHTAHIHTSFLIHFSHVSTHLCSPLLYAVSCAGLWCLNDSPALRVQQETPLLELTVLSSLRMTHTARLDLLPLCPPTLFLSFSPSPLLSATRTFLLYDFLSCYTVYLLWGHMVSSTSKRYVLHPLDSCKA